MADSDEAAETTQWRRAAKFYRRPLGVPWLIALVVIPLLLGAIGYGLSERTRSQVNGPTGALPTLAPPTGADHSADIVGSGVNHPQRQGHYAARRLSR